MVVDDGPEFSSQVPGYSNWRTEKSWFAGTARSSAVDKAAVEAIQGQGKQSESDVTRKAC